MQHRDIKFEGRGVVLVEGSERDWQYGGGESIYKETRTQQTKGFFLFLLLISVSGKKRRTFGTVLLSL